MLYQQVREILKQKGWVTEKDLAEEDDEFLWFSVGENNYAIIKKDAGKELDSLSIICGDLTKFNDDLMPDIFVVASFLNSKHTLARVAIHSHIYDDGFEGNMWGFEFSTPKCCLGNVEAALDTAVDKLDAIRAEFYERMDEMFSSKD